MYKNNLLNRKNKKQLVHELNAEPFVRITCSFYKYIKLNNLDLIRNELYTKFKEIELLGRIYIADEGINAQISVPELKWNRFKEILESFSQFKDLEIKKAVINSKFSFIKLTIKIKNKLVADGLNNNLMNSSKTGTYLTASEFNKAMDNPKSIVVDIRNYYESEVGHFNDAICPDAENFRDLLPLVRDMLQNKKDHKLLLYCTGGIRCEKASTFLINDDFKDVNQLQGGIISYYHQVKEKKLECKFKGKNFVFDSRMGENITNDIISNCHQCNTPSNRHTNCNNQACHILFIQCNKCNVKLSNCCSNECQKIAAKSLEEQKILRKTPEKAAPLRQYQRGTKPRLKDLIRKRSN